MVLLFNCLLTTSNGLLLVALLWFPRNSFCLYTSAIPATQRQGFIVGYGLDRLSIYNQSSTLLDFD